MSNDTIACNIGPYVYTDAFSSAKSKTYFQGSEYSPENDYEVVFIY
jgi:hypothetical protein